jgi:PAS domain S-box-containing protein
MQSDRYGRQTAYEIGAVDCIASTVCIDELVKRVATQLELLAFRNDLEFFVAKRTAELETENQQLRKELQEVRADYKELSAREHEFRILTEYSPDNIARYDRRCRKTYINPQLEKTLGVNASELVGLTPTEVKPGDPQLVAYQKKIQEVLNTGQTSDFEFLTHDKDKRVSYHNIRFVAEYDKQGQVAGVVAFGRDVTELRAIERQNALFAVMAQNSDDVMIFAHTLDAKAGLPMLYYNQSLSRHLGYSDEEMKKLPVADISKFSTSDLAKHMERLRRDGALRIETEHICKDGTSIPVEVMLSYLVHNGEEMAVGYCLDISKRKVVEQRLFENEHALRTSERKFRTLAENTPDNVVRYDRNCRTIYANPQVETLMTHSFEPMIGKAPTEIAPGVESFKRYQKVLERVLITGKPACTELEIEFSDKETQVHQINIVAERCSDGVICGALAIGRDITSLKENEKCLEESHAQLQELSKRRESARDEERKHLARELHDDLGQYLTALGLQAAALQIRYCENDDALREMIGQIFSLVEGMKKSVRNLSQRLRPEALDIGLKEALEVLVYEILSPSGIGYKIELHENLGDIDEANSVVIYRVTQESLTNIVRYAEANNVLLSLVQKNGYLVLKIEDDGEGFDMLEVKSTSFGLVGMRERLQAVGGEMEIISEHKKGTSVVAFIPTS